MRADTEDRQIYLRGTRPYITVSYGWSGEVPGFIDNWLTNITSNIRTLEDGRVFIHDIDGNCFQIPDPTKLDKASLKKIEIYM